MSSLQEIELAISGLSPDDQAKLLRDLPSLVPDLNGDLAWQRILSDPSPSETLSKFVDGVDAEFAANPQAFPEINESDFDRNS